MSKIEEFVHKWKLATLTETSGSQSHFIELCNALGQPTPTGIDVTGEKYTFEKGCSKLGGGEGWADVWFRDHFAWEYKGKHKDLAAAYKQLIDYFQDLDNPPLLVVSDMEVFQVHTNFNYTKPEVFRFHLDDLLQNKATPTCAIPPLEVLRALFEEPARLRPGYVDPGVTEDAATQFVKLGDSLRQRHNPEVAAHFLMRLLFCLFADGIGLLPDRVFSALVFKSRDNPKNFSTKLRQLFAAMAQEGGQFGVHDIDHFDGGLFSDDNVLDLTTGELQILSATATLNWAKVEPAIFGTLFERTLNPGKRTQVGTHYTSREDILRIVEPVVMAPLRNRTAQAQKVAAEQFLKANETKGVIRKKHLKAATDLLVGLADELSRVRILDPACGSGNFLYVALKLLLDLEREVRLFGVENGLTGWLSERVNPAQLYGIELDTYAHELASVVVWIGYLQWLHDAGSPTPSRPILKPLGNIVHADAVLSYDEQGQPKEPQWPDTDFIIGNPPFVGDKKMRRELGHKFVDDLRSLYRGRIPGQSDLVCYWFEKASAALEAGKAKRVGLLATQGIRGGANRTVLGRIKASGDIFWAESDRNWFLEGATVHVSMVGFDDGTEQSKILNGKPVSHINSNLTTGVDVTKATRLAENAGRSFIGTQKGGPFDIEPQTATKMLAEKGNPNHRPNSDVVRPWVNGEDLTDRNRGMWIIDFGADMSMEEAAKYAAPFEYVKKFVHPVRKDLRRKNHRERWWLHAEARPGMREALSGLSRFIVTPRVSKHRVFVWCDASVLPDSAVVAIASGECYFFGILQSRFHEVWARSTGTQLREAESGFRYTPQTCFETFPFPYAPGTEDHQCDSVRAIADAAGNLDQQRQNWLNPSGATTAVLSGRTLTNLYNDWPTWLQDLHEKLDKAVAAAYGWGANSKMAEEEILVKLVALNQQRTPLEAEDAEADDDGEGE